MNFLYKESKFKKKKRKKKKKIFFLSSFGVCGVVGVGGGWGWGGTSESEKDSFFLLLFWRGWGEGG